MGHPPRTQVWLRWDQEVVYFLAFCLAKRQNVPANDKALRSEESAEEKWQYIRENPVRAGSLENWQDWPYRVGSEL